MSNSTTSRGYFTTDGVKLQDISGTGRKRPWEEKKVANERLALAYDEVRPDKATRLRCCCQELSFATVDGKPKLVGAQFCRVRLCPVCSWRRSLKVMAQTRAVVDAINKDHRVRYILLSLTVQNCRSDQLDKLITDLMSGYDRLTRTVEWQAAVKGWLRSMEVTHNVKADTYHPHFHVLMAVSPDYFRNKHYLPQERWTALWQRSMRLDYTPVVDVRKVRGSSGKVIAEVAKYSVKDSDYLIPNDWEMTVATVRILDSALHRRRFIAYGGLLKEYHKKLHLDHADEGDLVHVEAEDKPLVDINTPVFTYFWAGYRQAH